MAGVTGAFALDGPGRADDRKTWAGNCNPFISLGYCF